MKRDVNCRCKMHQRAKWALDEKKLEELKKRGEFFGLDNSIPGCSDQSIGHFG